MDQVPLVSVIVPCRNEAAHIRKCVESILAQEQVTEGFEVLIVDGRSDDGSRELLEKLAREHPQIRVLDNPQRIVSTALNIGVRAARGSITVRLDAHSEYAPDYIAQCLQVLEETGAQNVGGPHRARGNNYLERVMAAAHHSSLGTGGASCRKVDYEGFVDTVIYGCWRKDTLIRIGFFDEELVRNQDDELNFRITRSGGRIWQSPRIKSWYTPRSSLRAVFRQYWQYGYWKVLVMQKHGRPASWRHLAPGTFVGLLGLNILLFPFVPGVEFSLAANLLLYGSANLLMASYAAKEHGWSLLPVLPLALACKHFGYGLGFLQGLWDFVILQQRSPESMKSLTR